MKLKFTKLNLWRVFLPFIILGLVLATYSRREVTCTCLYCRLEKTVITYWGTYVVNRYESNECSDWYESQNPNHEHDWKWRGNVSKQRFLTGSLGSGKRHPVWDINPMVQLTFLSNATEQEKNMFFKLLESDSKEDHYAASNMAYECFENIMVGGDEDTVEKGSDRDFL